MKKIYLVGRIDKIGHFTGNLHAYSSYKKAEQRKEYLNAIFNTNEFIIEQHAIE